MERINIAETTIAGPPPVTAAAAQEEEPEGHVVAVPMVLDRNESYTGDGPRLRSSIPSTAE